MSKIRWKWIFYHVYSNVLTIILLVIMLFLFLPPYITQNMGITLLLYIFSLGIIASVATGAICGFKFSKNIRNRLEEVSLGAKNLAYGNLKYRLPFTDDRELGDIALSFNEMAQRLEKQVGALQTLAEENEKLVQRTKTSAVTEERQRLARDLHDAVSQQLFAISMISATASKIASKDPVKCASLITSIEESAGKAQAEMRALLLQLRPVTLDNQPLADAIASLASELQTKQAIECELHLDQAELPSNIENQLYRVVQESLSNVLRHAEASKVAIRFSVLSDKDRVSLVIDDNGKGFNEQDIAKTSYGLSSIKERISQLGGTVNWVSFPGKGTRIEVRIPIVVGRGDKETP